MVGSLTVAEVFEKIHKNVLKAIENHDCSPEFTARNFAPSTYKDKSGKKNPCYNMTKDGFAGILTALNFEPSTYKDKFARILTAEN